MAACVGVNASLDRDARMNSLAPHRRNAQADGVLRALAEDILSCGGLAHATLILALRDVLD